MVNEQVIHLSELEIGCCYFGKGRYSNIGVWDGECFIVLANTMIHEDLDKCAENMEYIKYEPYCLGEASAGFKPFVRIYELIDIPYFIAANNRRKAGDVE